MVRGALRKVAASLSAAARGVSDTLPSSRAKCSLRGALRGGSAAPGSAGIGRRTEQNGPERRPDLPSVSLSGRRWGRGSLARGGPRPCPPPHAAFRTLCPQAGQSVRSEAHYAAAVPRPARLASGGGPGKAGRKRRPALPLVSLSGRRCGRGSLARGGPRPCPPPHAAFRTLCPPTGQSVRSEAHYAAAAPRPIQPTSKGQPGKTGQSAALPALFFRPACPGPALLPPEAPFARREQKIGKIRLFCDISAFVNRICF